jgi:hypothetical protein
MGYRISPLPGLRTYKRRMIYYQPWCTLSPFVALC